MQANVELMRATGGAKSLPQIKCQNRVSPVTDDAVAQAKGGRHVGAARTAVKTLTLNQWKIISAAIIGDMLDFFDFFLIGYVLAFIVGAWKLTFLESGTILLAAGVGAIPGAFFWGWMADRIGRRKVFIATALNFSIATGIMALTPDQYGWIFLSVCRFVVGIGVAGLIAVDLPLVQEFVPSTKRGWVGGIVTSTISIGGALGAACGAYLGPVIGWRGLFLIGLLPALLTLLIRAWVLRGIRVGSSAADGTKRHARRSPGLSRSTPKRLSYQRLCPRRPTPHGVSCLNTRAVWRWSP